MEPILVRLPKKGWVDGHIWRQAKFWGWVDIFGDDFGLGPFDLLDKFDDESYHISCVYCLSLWSDSTLPSCVVPPRPNLLAGPILMRPKNLSGPRFLFFKSRLVQFTLMASYQLGFLTTPTIMSPTFTTLTFTHPSYLLSLSLFLCKSTQLY